MWQNVMKRKLFVKSFLLVFVAFLVSLSPTKLFAIDDVFYSGNDILYYEPNAGRCNPTVAPPSDTGTVAIVANENVEAFVKYFTAEQGFSLAAAAGMAGNIMMESHFNPAIKEGSTIASDDENILGFSGGFGIAQWTDTARKQNLINFAKQKHAKITDLMMQIEFVAHELESSSYTPMLQKLDKNKTDPVAAAIVFHGLTPNIEREGASINPIFKAAGAGYGYERSGDTSDQVVKNRGGSGTSIFNTYEGKISDGTGVKIKGGGDTSTPSTATSEALAACQNKDNASTSSDLGPGKGDFSDIGEVKGWDNVLHNSQATDRLFGESLEGDGYCAAIVSRVWHGQDIGYGYHTDPNTHITNDYAVTLWYEQEGRAGHVDRNVKKGAILLYRSTHQSAGHIVIYLGDNKVLNDGHIRDAAFIEDEGWHEIYLGWIDPNDIGWTSVSASDSTLRSILSGY